MRKRIQWFREIPKGVKADSIGLNPQPSKQLKVLPQKVGTAPRVLHAQKEARAEKSWDDYQGT